MPFIEIASMHSPGLNLRQEDFNVAIIENHKRKSCNQIFDNFFNGEDGTIIHIGDPDLRNDKNNVCFASEIIDWDFEPVDIIYFPEIDDDFETCTGGENQQFKFKFLSRYKRDIDRLLRVALRKSPIKKGYILSDYQFGPSIPQIEIISRISDFWSRHDQEGLMYNTVYELYGS
ncbi:hypothetical protein [Dyadobacter sp. NIV53]|uniref:hypothetical protein n=1 Tax=Dyadobacter sp. NIV53 TaxID=2861765 RepID=UPI001C87F03E|nr:hypothetical protein [Dyadobacter sp. NIV53]